MRVLAIESSCDESAVAVLDEHAGLIAHELFSQVDLHRVFGGVVPELASRDHVKKLLPLVRGILEESARRVEGLLLSPHRAGALPDSLLEIGRQTVADVELILRGLPPLSCRRAQRETVALSRSKPVERL